MVAVLAAALIGGWLIFRWLTYTCCSEPTNKTPANAEVACEEKGGSFIEELEVCKFPASDAGKICNNSSECEGICDANLSSEEILQIDKGGQIKKTGTCGQWNNFFERCSFTVENGKVGKVCVD